MEWRGILCQASYSEEIIAGVQQALKYKGYAIQKVDGDLGPNTMRELNRFQADQQLPVDQHLNIL